MLKVFRMGKFSSSLDSFFTGIDAFGYRVHLLIDKSETVKSKVGAFITLFILGFAFYTFILNIEIWSNNEKLQTISSSQSFTTQELLQKQKTFDFVLDYHNFNLYFALAQYIPKEDGSSYSYDELKHYFTQEFSYQDKNEKMNILEAEPCYLAKKNERHLPEE